MSFSFKIEKNNDDEKKEIEVEDYNEDEDDNDDNDDEKNKKNDKLATALFSKGSPELRNKLIKLLGVAVGLLVLIIIIVAISSAIKASSKGYSYEQIEEIMRKAAVSYFEDYPESLPQSESQVMEISSDTLTSAGKMKDISSYTSKGVTCTGKVKVSKVGASYNYSPYLSCGDSYSSTRLLEVAIASTVTSGYGLYKVDSDYIYRGETVNNYVKLDNNLWRIVKIASNNDIVLISDTYYSIFLPWDNRYNTNSKYNSGINNYATSRIKESLESLYLQDTTNKKVAPILSNNDKSKLVAFNQCVGKRKKEETEKNNSIECASTYDNVYIGLLTVSDYMLASADENCKTSIDPVCQNYNYLNIKQDYWLATATEESTDTVYYVSKSGTIKTGISSNYAGVRPVIHLNGSTMVSGGSGTKSDPYLIK